MVIIGARGLAKQILPALDEQQETQFVFFDDQYIDVDSLSKYRIVHSKNEVQQLFVTDPGFAIAVGAPGLRRLLCNEFEALAGRPASIIHTTALISGTATNIGPGVLILQHCIIESFVGIGKGVLINIGSKICHDSSIEDFCEIGPNVTITGNCHIGEECSLGASVTIIPNVRVGRNTTIGAGAVVTKDLPENCVAAGVPARIIRYK